jgi:hypothetical protein
MKVVTTQNSHHFYGWMNRQNKLELLRCRNLMKGSLILEFGLLMTGFAIPKPVLASSARTGKIVN